ncbi:MAG: nitroreductase family protein [Spirochaetia bacterium]
MIVIDHATCSGCGQCVNVCHEHCMSLMNGKVAVDHAVCSTCTQCIAVCPRKALSWDGVQPQEYDHAALPSAAALDELLKERRTIRDFTPEGVDRTTLEEIVSCGADAPTHNFHLRCIVVDRADIIELFDKEAFLFSQRVYRRFFQPPLMRKLVALAPQLYREEFARARPKLEAGRQRGKAFKSRPAALLCVIGDARVPLSLESAQYALYNMTLFAQVKGLGCQNLVGNQMVFNRSKAIRLRLRLGKHEKIVAMMGVGHPAVTFMNKVLGKRMKVQWNEGQS